MRLKAAFIYLLLPWIAAATNAAPGLAVHFSQNKQNDAIVLPYPALHVPTHERAAQFLGPGPFAAQFTGWITVDLRSQYILIAELSGGLELQINGKEVLTVDRHEGISTHASKAVRLNKGTNSIVARYSSPSSSAATFRLLWSTKTTPVPIPIPVSALSHTPTPELERSLSAHNGAFLFQHYNCASCHGTSGASTGGMTAPGFAGIGSRLTTEWMASWISDPSHQRKARMPALLQGPAAKEQAEAIATFLTSLQSTPPPKVELRNDLREAGETLVKELQCGSCHRFSGQTPDINRIPLNHVSKKFKEGALISYLQNPHEHYQANPMPDFRMTQSEAQAVASFLADGKVDKRSDHDRESLIISGRSLIQRSGCLNCHKLDLPNQFSAPAFETIVTNQSRSGCLDKSSSTSPRFDLDDAARDDLAAFLDACRLTGQSEPSRSEKAFRMIETLGCAKCHEEAGLPTPASLGGKLRPEWTTAFIAGEAPYKPRPWLKARMPAFPYYADLLGQGLAALHGYGTPSQAEGPIDDKLSKTGATLVSANGGFSCGACHAVGAINSAAVVESPGINLAYSGERLLPDFFKRWVMNPIAIDPSTKMPVYFDNDGRSQLLEVFDGDAAKQVEAMWHYIRLGNNMPPPPAP